MIRSLPYLLLGLLALGVPAVGRGADRHDATIRVSCDEPGHAISPRLIGAFFEDINFGADGGLSAELVKNGSFATPQKLLGWDRIGDQAAISVETEAPLSASNPTFVRVNAQNGEERGVANEGFRGMGVHAGESLQFACWGRSSAGRSARVLVRLVAESGQTLAETSFDVAGSAWREAVSQLTPSESDLRARLELVVSGQATVDLDQISLCPLSTWKDRPHGLRRDLVQLLADLKPAFFRFPGGCIVEGSQLKYRYRWKSTIGPLDERRLIVNRWKSEFAHRPAPDYYQSFALGFYEYFQLAEDIGAEPMPILNCGMACQFNSGELVPLEELESYIQDALDLIEFANGDANSEWGAVRAAMGHPKPFDMRLLGVGNEQWGPEYFARYERFAEALQREHPEIELISTSGPFPSGDRFDYAWPLLRKMTPTPIVDEHCYAMPDWFLREAHRYDDYDRDGPQVLMGEYAAQSVQIASPRNRNTLRCALAEAAFLTGVERNSDVVTMSAYAPLFAHEDAWQWRPDLIWFDNLGSYGTPSYHVQKVFSQHRGDVTLPVELIDHRAPAPTMGCYGLGSHNTAVEFRNIQVTRDEQTLLDSETSLTLDSLTVHQGDWAAENGVIRQPNRRGSSRALLGDPKWSNSTIAVQARKTSGSEGFALFFRCGPGGSRIEWNIGGWGNQQHGLIAHLATHSESPVRFDLQPGNIEEGRWYELRVETRGEQVRCYLDGELIHDITIPNPTIDRLFACAAKRTESGESIVKVVNPTDDFVVVRLELEGVQPGARTCRVTELTGDPEDVNTIADPLRIVPQERVESVGGAQTERTFPPHSLTVLRIEGT